MALLNHYDVRVVTDAGDAVLIEPSATVNTGDSPGELTAERRVV